MSQPCSVKYSPNYTSLRDWCLASNIYKYPLLDLTCFGNLDQYLSLFNGDKQCSDSPRPTFKGVCVGVSYVCWPPSTRLLRIPLITFSMILLLLMHFLSFRYAVKYREWKFHGMWVATTDILFNVLSLTCNCNHARLRVWYCCGGCKTYCFGNGYRCSV